MTSIPANGADANGVDALQVRLNDPGTVDALNRLLDRIDTLEESVDKLSNAAGQAPQMVAMMADIADESSRDAAARGIDIDARLHSLLGIAEKLTEPRTVEVLSGLLDRMDQLEELVKLTDQLPGAVAMAADIVDDTYATAAAAGVDVEARTKAGLALAEKLTAPQNMATLTKLVDQMDKVDTAVGMLDQAPGMMAMGMDITDDIMARAMESGLDVDKFTTQGLSALIKFSSLVASDEFDELVFSGILDTETIAIVSDVGETLVECKKDPPRRLSILGLARELNDPDAKVAMGFLANFAKHFGHRICEERRRELGML